MSSEEQKDDPAENLHKENAESPGDDDTTSLSTFGTAELATLHFLQPDMLAQPFSRDIFLIRLYVAGCGHIDNMLDKLRQLMVGQKLTLLREPDNPCDKRAILVLNDGVKLGYVPRWSNIILANLMDAGKYLCATVDGILDDPDDSQYPWQALSIQILMKD